MRNFISIVLLLINGSILAQDLHQEFLNKIDTVDKSLEYFLDGNEYIVYATFYRALYIVKVEQNYHELIYEDRGQGFKLKKINLLHNKILKDLFVKKNYEQGIISIDSDFYKKGINSINGLPSYFSYRLNTHTKYCEYIISIIIDPVPFNEKLYNYISLRFLEIENK